MAAAQDGLFPPLFGRLSPRGVPAFGHRDIGRSRDCAAAGTGVGRARIRRRVQPDRQPQHDGGGHPLCVLRARRRSDRCARRQARSDRVGAVEIIAFLFSVFTLYGCGATAVLYGLMLLILRYSGIRLATAPTRAMTVMSATGRCSRGHQTACDAVMRNGAAGATYARGECPVQRRNARLKLLVSEKPSMYAISVIDMRRVVDVAARKREARFVDDVLKRRVALREFDLQRARAHVHLLRNVLLCHAAGRQHAATEARVRAFECRRDRALRDIRPRSVRCVRRVRGWRRSTARRARRGRRSTTYAAPRN